MKINVRVQIKVAARSLFMRDSILKDAIDWSKDFFWWEADASSPILDRVIELAHQVDGLTFQVRTELTKKELESVSLYEMYPTKGDPTMSDADHMANFKYIDSLERICFKPNDGVRILDRFYLSNVKVKPDANSIYPAFDCFMATQDVCSIFEEEELSGLKFGPVSNSKTEAPSDKVQLLVPTHIMPECVQDQSVRVHSVTPQGTNSYGVAGCISYSPEVTKMAKDFNCSCESYGGVDVGTTIVSKRFVDVVQRHEIKGARFYPVLDTTTALYATYHVAHQHFIQKLQNNPMNRW